MYQNFEVELSAWLPNLHVQLQKLWIQKSGSSCKDRCLKICPFNLSSCVIIYWTSVQFKNLAIQPLTPKPKPPSISVAVIVVAHGEYHKREVQKQFCSQLILCAQNTRKIYAHQGIREVCSYNHPNSGKHFCTCLNYAR